jgi:hypothetical protein
MVILASKEERRPSENERDDKGKDGKADWRPDRQGPLREAGCRVSLTKKMPAAGMK